jgi:hypothetical protein
MTSNGYRRVPRGWNKHEPEDGVVTIAQLRYEGYRCRVNAPKYETHPYVRPVSCYVVNRDGVVCGVDAECEFAWWDALVKRDIEWDRFQEHLAEVSPAFSDDGGAA